MDSETGRWTTPDAYAGNVHDPMSQKPFMWNRNNPYEYSDPSGFDPATPQALADKVQNAIQNAAFGHDLNSSPRAFLDAARDELRQMGIASFNNKSNGNFEVKISGVTIQVYASEKDGVMGVGSPFRCE